MESLKYFLKYVAIDTQSDDASQTAPSTLKQLNLAKVVLQDLKDLGLDNAYIDEFGQVHAFLDGESKLPTIGLNSHMDTAPDYTGKDVKPNIISNYDGKPIQLNNNLVLDPEVFPILKAAKGSTVVTTDGTTLLGADDKAGISIIMNLLSYLVKNPNIKHHPLSIMFTCDEEIGRGADHFDNNIFKAKYAFTVDGASPFIAEYENFNAAHAIVKITGTSIHPGEAKGKMINAASVAMEFDSLLNSDEVPEKTEGYEGFHHLTDIKGDTAFAQLEYIIRDHDINKLHDKVADFEKAKQEIMSRYPKLKGIELITGYDYKNMKEKFVGNDDALKKIELAYKNLGINFSYEAIRGGTDGATFSYKGCPTPNLGTGSYNHHGPLEFLVKEQHDLMIEVLKEIVKA